MADEHLLRKVHSLSDLELAFLLSLIAREHCQIRTPSSTFIPDLVAELSLIATKIFRLQPAVIACTPQTTLDDFASALLLPPPAGPSATNSPTSTFRSPSPLATRNGGPSSSYFYAGHSSSSTAPTIAPVILAANLDLAPKAVQIQALELLRTRRVFTRTSVHTAPKTFLFVAVVSDDRAGGEGGQGLNRWLNDWFYLAHAHSPEEDGYPNLEEEYENENNNNNNNTDDVHTGLGLQSHDPYPYPDTDAASTASSSSVVVRTTTPSKSRLPSFSARPPPNGKLPPHPGQQPPDDDEGEEEPTISDSDISHLSLLSQSVRTDISIVRYQHNIVSFLRMHRAVSPGSVTPLATKHLEQLCKSLAPLHGLDYVTPGLVKLAARKVYLHRLRIVPPERERSVQWGSELGAVERLLDGVGGEDVVEDVLGMVTAPL
ncbi:hypothetical protein GE09DRAFT_156681 [Coniochaeta sp. 2T2.1]|nr:hypothetical protein GE09DRAFT_156681 [Coniochaeta sp. 2T2.1]